MKSRKIFHILLAMLTLVVGGMLMNFGHEGAGLITAISPAMMNALSGRARAVYNYIQQEWGQTGDPNIDGAVASLIATQSYLRCESLITNSASKYTFDILANGNETPVERKLNKNDVFIVTHLAGYLIQYTAVAGVIQKWTSPLQTYPNATYFAGTPTPGDLNVFYNGFLNISVGRVKFFDGYPAHLFAKYPRTQQTTSANYSDRELSDGGASIEPLAILSGSANNTIEWNIPMGQGALAIADNGATTVTKVVFHPFGFLVNNAANYVNY